MSASKFVAVGTPPSGYRRWESVEVEFHGFAELPAENFADVDSPEFTRLGHRWHLSIFPGGDDSSDEGKVAAYLHNLSDESIEIEYLFSVRNLSGTEIVVEIDREEFEPHGDGRIFIFPREKFSLFALRRLLKGGKIFP